MSPRSWFPLLLVAVLVAACSSGPATDTSVGPVGDLGPEGVVRSLLADVQAGRYDHAASLTDAEQAVLLTLAEGADATDVTESLTDGGTAVAANFWSGFAQTLDPAEDTSGWPVEVGEEIEEGGDTFVAVRILPGEDDTRTLFLRRNGTWQVDMMASFGPILAERLTPPVESLLSSANANAASVLALLVDSVPSLQVAEANTELPPATHQAVLGLIERITRAG